MNLTPTQKADELIEKFRALNVTLLGCGNPSNPCIITSNMLEKSAIQCAIVAVDQILIMRWNLPHYGSKEGMIFWQEVKTILTDRL